MFLAFISENSIDETSDLKPLIVDKQMCMASKSNKSGKAKTHSWKWEKHILFSKTTGLGWLKPTVKLNPWGIPQPFLAYRDRTGGKEYHDYFLY